MPLNEAVGFFLGGRRVFVLGFFVGGFGVCFFCLSAVLPFVAEK